MSALRQEIVEHFMTYSTGERELSGFEDSFRTYTVKREGYFGVAIKNTENIDIYESFQNAELKSVYIDIKGNYEPYLLLSSTHANEKIKFSYICEDFVRLGNDNEYRKKITKNPASWWIEWGTLMGDTKSNKTPYSVLAELWTYNKELQKGNKTITWEGSKAKNHDFESENYNIEVKSTVSMFSEEVTISNQFQMLHENDLYLYFLIMQDNIDGISIDDVLKDLVSNGVDSDVLEKHLALLGMPKGNSSRIKRYKIIEARKYKVDGDFPMINSNSFIKGEIPKGIKKISYTVDLSMFDFVKID